MATTWEYKKSTGSGELTGTGTQDEVYEAPASTQAVIKHVKVVNHDSSDRTVQMWQGAVADANMVLPPLTIPAGGWAEFNGDWFVDAEEIIYAEGSAGSALTVHVYVVEFS